MKGKIILTFALLSFFKFNFSSGIRTHVLKYEMNEESIFKSRNLYDKVWMDLSDEVLSIVSGKFQYKSKMSANLMQKTSKSIIYNRVNKCGSTSILQLVEDLGFQNGYIVVSRRLPKVRTLLEGQKSTLSNLLCDPAAPRMVLSRHLNYVDWGGFDCDVRYFNQVMKR